MTMADVRLIDANALLDTVIKYSEIKNTAWPVWIENLINCAPTIDAAEVVRCRECKFYRNAGCPMRSLHAQPYGYAVQDNTVADGFCHRGAKMDGKE